MAKTYDEQLADIRERQKELDVKMKERQKQLKAQEKKILARKNTAEQKAHNKRIYEIGAMFESALGRSVEVDEIDALNDYFKEQKQWIERALSKNREEL